MAKRTTNAPPRAAIYCRVSTGKQENGASLETQEASCRKHAAEHGYVIDEAHVYREVYTGAELWDRPHLATLRGAIRHDAIQVVLCHAIDRLSRDPVHLGVILTEAEHHRVAVGFVTEPLDNTPEGQLIRFVRGYAAQVEREKIRERALRGKRARIDKGKLHAHGRELYGYRRDNEKGVRVIHDGEAAILRQVYHWYVHERMGIKTITGKLNADGIPSPSMGKVGYKDANGNPRPTRWGNGAVRRLLTDPTYKGETIEWRWKDGGKVRAQDEWVYLPEGVTPPIVSPALWEQAQQRIQTNRGLDGRNKARPYLLRGFIVCAVCGLPMRASPERGIRTYRCASREKASGPCGGKRVPGDGVEAWAWEQVTAVLKDPSIIAREVERRRTEGPDQEFMADREAAQRHLASLDKQQAKLLRLFRELDDTALPVDFIKRELTQIEKERSQALGVLQDTQHRLNAHEKSVGDLQSLTTYCDRVAQNLETFGFDEKRLALEALAIQVIGNGREWRLKGSIPMGEMAGMVSTTSAHYAPQQPLLQARV